LSNLTQEKDIENFKFLFNKHFKQIRNFIYYRTANIELAEDLSQDCFFKLWEKIGQIRNETALSYVYKIARNLTIDAIKEKTERFELEFSITPANSETPEHLMEQMEFDRQLKKAIACLSFKQREVFLMNRIDDLTYKEIARTLDISEKAVEKRMAKALKFLNQNLKMKL